MKVALTSRQQEIYDYIVGHIEEHGYQPSMREMCEVFGVTSINGIRVHLKAICKKGWVEAGPPEARAVRLIGVKFKRVEDDRATTEGPGKMAGG